MSKDEKNIQQLMEERIHLTGTSASLGVYAVAFLSSVRENDPRPVAPGLYNSRLLEKTRKVANSTLSELEFWEIMNSIGISKNSSVTEILNILFGEEK